MPRDERIDELLKELNYENTLGVERDIREIFFNTATALVDSVPVDSAQLFTSLRHIRFARDHALSAPRITK
jgi:hypothetical protein